jgi:hypothetical protein
MDRELGASIMLVGILSIVALAIVLWLFQCARFLLTSVRGRTDLTEVGGSTDDPDDVGMNDKDIL